MEDCAHPTFVPENLIFDHGKHFLELLSNLESAGDVRSGFRMNRYDATRCMRASLAMRERSPPQLVVRSRV